jgi:hypothetical protein
MTKLFVITDEYDGKRLFINQEDVRQATVQDAIDCDWSLDDIYGSSLDEYLDEDGELLESELTEDLDEYYFVEYWDGNNWRKELLDVNNISEVEGIITVLDPPSPAFYFNYEIQLENGEKIQCTQSNCSGSLSPYYEEKEIIHSDES